MTTERRLIKTVVCWWCGGIHPGGHRYLRGACPYHNDKGPDSWYEAVSAQVETPPPGPVVPTNQSTGNQP